MSLNLKETFEKDYVKGYFHRNKKIFLLAIILFLLLGSIGTIIEPDPLGFDVKNVSENVQTDKNADPENYSFEGFILLFIHNFINDLTAVLGGLFLFIPTLYITFINATNMVAIFVKWPPLLILLGVLPHGIFEIPSSIFGIAGGLMLFKLEINVIKAIIKSNGVRKAINDSQTLVKDAILTIVIIFVLLLIAALIETFVTPLLLGLY